MYWDETPGKNTNVRSPAVPQRKRRGVADRERQEYRLAAYRAAHERLRVATVDGAATRTTAVWRALRDVCGEYDLEPTEWGLLINCLMATPYEGAR